MTSPLDDFGIPDSVTHEIEVQKKISERSEALKTLPNHEELQEVLNEIRFGSMDDASESRQYFQSDSTSRCVFNKDLVI